MTDANEMREIVTLRTEAFNTLKDIAEMRGLELGETLDMIVTQWHNAAWNGFLDDYDHVAEVSEIEYDLQSNANTLASIAEDINKLARNITTRRLLLEAKHRIGEEE